MKVLILAAGTHGDVLPFVAIGRELVRRGHEVAMHAPAPFARHAERAGLSFHPYGTEEDFNALLDRPEFRKVGGALRFWTDLILDVAQQTVPWIERHADIDDTVVVAPPPCYGARIAQERLGLPTATVHIMPLYVESRIASPRLPGLPVPGFLPSRFRHWLSRGADRLVLDRVALPKLNAYRAQCGLPPVARLREWWDSPNRMILTFPDWYAAPQLDWPLQAVQVGFPFADRLGDASELPPDLAAFLDDGEAPLVFTYTSWMRGAQAFFAVAVRACERMGRRGILLSPQAGQVPQALHPGILHVPYAPLSLLLPRCAALVHHGGVGTVALALAAGVPQVVVPFTGDQFDEGERVRRIGAGEVLSRWTLTARGVERALSRLLADPVAKRACKAARKRIGREDGVARACDVIEALPREVKKRRHGSRPASRPSAAQASEGSAA